MSIQGVWEMSKRKGKAGGLRLPGPGVPAEEEFYLMEDPEGFLVRVPAGRLEDWERAQAERGSAPLSKSEQQVSDAIVRRIYG